MLESSIVTSGKPSESNCALSLLTDIRCSANQLEATIVLPTSFVIEPEFNDIVDPKAPPSLCLITPIKHRLHPTYKIEVRDFKTCGVRSAQVRASLDEDSSDHPGAPIETLLNRLHDKKKHSNGTESLLGSRKIRAGLRKYRNKKHLKRAITSPNKSSASLVRVLQVNIRFPVVKSLRTDEDTYATLICELDDADDDDDRGGGNSLSRRYSALSIGETNDDDEDWDTSDKGYTIRVKPPDDFFKSTVSPVTNATGSSQTPTTTELASNQTAAVKASVVIEPISPVDAEPAVEESKQRSIFSKHRPGGDQTSTEASQAVKATIDDTVAETTSIKPYSTSLERVISIGPFARGNQSDPLRILTRLEPNSQGKGMDYEQVRETQINAQSGPIDNVVKVNAGPMADQRPSNASAVGLGNGSHNVSKETNVVSVTTGQPPAFNSLKSAETHYLANFIISSISSLLILTFMFALLVMDTCVDVRHPSGSDI